ncbi:MAG: phosphonate metabolism protein PhnM, partial [Pseudomonadota bacterium]
MSIRFEGARVILRDEVVETDVTVAAGKIVAVGTAAPADQHIDARGLTLAPALIDVHGDAFERQVMPRPKV